MKSELLPLCTLLDRNEWKGHPEALKASENEKQGILANGTWDETDIGPKSEILAMAKSSGKNIHIGSLMVIVSIKGFEKPSNECVVKARVVFRGDAVRDEENQAAVVDDIAASAPKLRHLSKLHKINVASTCEAFLSSEPMFSQSPLACLRGILHSSFFKWYRSRHEAFIS